ncbi:MAG: enolase [Candidatus Micrarchaeota archaeon]
MKIRAFAAREVLDSRGNPTLEIEVNGCRATVPSGASTGIHEALELRDGGGRYHGKGVLNAAANAEKALKKAKGKNFASQKDFDDFLLELDGTQNKSKLGANATIGCSIAFFKALAASKNKQAYSFFKKPRKLPIPAANVVNGGAHAGNGLSIQEFLILPLGIKTTAERVRACSEIYQTLKKTIASRFGRQATAVGDEGGFAPPARRTEEVLELVSEAIGQSGYGERVFPGLDCAASQFYKHGVYMLDGLRYSPVQLADHYAGLQKAFGLKYIEDPFFEEDFENFALLTRKLAGQALVVGDDLLVTNPERIKTAIAKKSCSALLLKTNQIGTITESLEANALARKAGWAVCVSHRSGETEDVFLADFATAINADLIKLGAPCRGERTAKYNELLRIAEKVD